MGNRRSNEVKLATNFQLGFLVQSVTNPKLSDLTLLGSTFTTEPECQE